MSEQIEPEVTLDDDEARPTWEVPEIAAMAVLLAFTALVLGGLVAGILLSTEVSGPVPRQFIGEAVEFGSSWAEPLLAVALLGVLGLSWWQIEARMDSGQDDESQIRRERAVLRPMYTRSLHLPGATSVFVPRTSRSCPEVAAERGCRSKTTCSTGAPPGI